jgi:hypothetical protein
MIRYVDHTLAFVNFAQGFIPTDLMDLKCQEMQTIRLCLKHFRERNMIDVFEALRRQTNIQLEDPLLTGLHRALVIEANYPEAEHIITKASKSGLFESYLKECDYTPLWHCIDTGK